MKTFKPLFFTLIFLGSALLVNAQQNGYSMDCECKTEPSKTAQAAANKRKIDFNREKGYALEKIGDDFYIGTDGSTTFSMAITSDGIIFIDAPVTITGRLNEIASSVSTKNITHIIYTHAHADHIGGFTNFKGKPVVIASKGAEEELERVANEKNPEHPFGSFVGGKGMVPLPTKIIKKKKSMTIGGVRMELNPLAEGHSDSDMIIYFPDLKILVASDMTWPASVPWVRLGQAENVMGLIASNKLLLEYDFDALVAGHAGEVGTKKDVEMTVAYLEDLKKATMDALNANNPEDIAQASGVYNGYGLMDIYFNKVVCEAAQTVKSKWVGKLQGAGIWSCEHAEKMMTALRMDHILPEEFEGK